MNQQQHTILIYTLFYQTNELPAKNLDLLKGLNRDNILRFLIAIRTAVARHKGPSIKQLFIQRFIKNLPKSTQKRVLTFLTQDNHAYFLTVPLIITQIITEVLNQAPEKEIPEKNIESYFALAMLDVIMIYNDHHFKILNIGNRTDSHELIWEMMLMQEINGDNAASFVRSGIIKQVIFLEFLKAELGTKYRDFEAAVSVALGAASISAYPILFVALQVVQDRQSTVPVPLVPITKQDELYNIIHNAGLVLDTTQQLKIDQGGVLMHPFLKLSDGVTYLMGTLDFGLITDKGWIYYLYNQGKLSDFFPKISSLNALYSFIGLNYTEKYLMGKVFKSMHRTGFRVLLSDDQQTPDVTIISNETDVFMIEIKSVSLNYKVWQNQEIDKFKQHLDNEYVKEKKGVIQLHKCINHLRNKSDSLFGIRTSLMKINLFPVIVYTEPHLNIVGVNDYVIKHSPALPNDVMASFNSISPVTMIHYDFFIENLSVIRQQKSLLKEVILHYHRSMKNRRQEHEKSKSTVNYLKAMAPFDDFIAGYKGFYRNDKITIAKELNKIFNSGPYVD
jgi:hypothetical protein